MSDVPVSYLIEQNYRLTQELAEAKHYIQQLEQVLRIIVEANSTEYHPNNLYNPNARFPHQNEREI